MREQLLAYLLGQLVPAEQQDVERALAEDANLQRELDCMRACLAESGISKSGQPRVVPPSGLAERTCRRVAASSWNAGSLARATPCIAGRWRVADMIVVVGIALATAALLLPAMQQSRHAARRTTCQNNLRILGRGLLELAQLQNGQIPTVPARGKDAVGGIYAVELADAEVIDREELTREIVCPSSRLASQLRREVVTIRIPTHNELLSAEGRRLERLRRVMGGSYAYRVGYLRRGRYCTMRIRQTGRVPLMADAPSMHLANFQSDNHAGCGQNVLFDDGRVRFLVQCEACNDGRGGKDHLYKNRMGYRAAGCDSTDAVLVPSPVGPAVEMMLGKNAAVILSDSQAQLENPIP